MEGVTILNEIEVVTKTIFSWESFWTGAILGAAFAILVIVLVMASDWDWACFGLVLGYALAAYGYAIPSLIYFLSGKWQNRPSLAQSL